MLNQFLGRVDKLVCYYLGLKEGEKDRPKTLKLIKNSLVVYNNTPFRRHRSQETWSHFNAHSIKNFNVVEKEKIGTAVGKAIAKGLKVSFENIEIKGAQ